MVNCKQITLSLAFITTSFFGAYAHAETSCTYEREYIDQHTKKYVNASNRFISAQRRQSRLKGMASIQNFSNYTRAYQVFSYHHSLSGKIANSEVCKDRIVGLLDAINAVNQYIRAEKSKINF